MAERIAETVLAEAEERAESASNDAIDGGEVDAEDVVAEAEAIVDAATHRSANGATPVENVAVVATEDPEVAAKREMNRREFLMYAWGAALGLVTLETAGAMFFFLYPRFRAGEFGGKFFVAPSEFGDAATPPKGNVDGKFWMVTTQDGNPKAIYMVCTHLGCLYKWQGSNNRFECPCHGSKFSHDGFYIEGPAPRSLDSFEIALENGQVAVNTGKKLTGSASADSPARAAPIA